MMATADVAAATVAISDNNGVGHSTTNGSERVPVPQLLYVDVQADGADPAKFLPSDMMTDLLDDPGFLAQLDYGSVATRGLEDFERTSQSEPRLKRYSRFHVQGALMMMGCKAVHSVAIMNAVFEGLASQAALAKGADTVTLTLTDFLRIIQYQLLRYQYARKSTVVDFSIACDLKAGVHSLIILLGGTSGCGKSTLASLLASRLGVTTVLSTDSVRHVMRNFIDPKEVPVLFASTYHAGESLVDDTLTPQERILGGYTQQCSMVQAQLNRILDACVARQQTIIVEGVHLTTDYLAEAMKRYRNCIPFMIYISNEAKHRERFAVRARYMTLSPHANKYVKYFENIRCIQNFLTDNARRFQIPMVDNTNIDRSLAAVHATLVNCMRKIIVPKISMFDVQDGIGRPLNKIYKHTEKKLWRNKDMLEIIHDKRRRYSWPPGHSSAEESTMSNFSATTAAASTAVTSSSGTGTISLFASAPGGLMAINMSNRSPERSRPQDDGDDSPRAMSPDDGQSGSEVSIDEFEKFSVDEFCGS